MSNTKTCFEPTQITIKKDGNEPAKVLFIPLPNVSNTENCKSFVRKVVDGFDDATEIQSLSTISSFKGNNSEYYTKENTDYVGSIVLNSSYNNGVDGSSKGVDFISCPSSNRTLYYAEKNNGENVFLTNTPKDVTINLDDTLNGINSVTALGNIKNEQNYKCIGEITSSESIKCPNDMVIEGIDYTSNGSESYVCNFTSDGDTYTVKDFLCKKDGSVTTSKGVVNNYVYDEDVYESNMFLSLKNDLLPDLGEDSFIKFDQDGTQNDLSFNKIVCTGDSGQLINIYVYDDNQSNLITSLSRLDEIIDDETDDEAGNENDGENESNKYSNVLSFYGNRVSYDYNAYKYGILNYKEEQVLVLMNTFNVVQNTDDSTYNIDGTPNNDIVFIYKGTDGKIKDVKYTLSSETETYSLIGTIDRSDLETLFNKFCEIYNSNDPIKLGEGFTHNITDYEITFTLNINNKSILETFILGNITDKSENIVTSIGNYNSLELLYKDDTTGDTPRYIPVFDLFLEKYYRDIFYINDSNDYVYLIKDYEDNNTYEYICGDVTFGMLSNSSTNQA